MFYGVEESRNEVSIYKTKGDSIIETIHDFFKTHHLSYFHNRL